MRLALGTVQFGLPYGVSNRGGQTTASEVRKILGFAGQVGLDTLDTAIDYGDSERVLGDVGVERFRIVTKLPSLPDDEDNAFRWVEAQVRASLHRLKVPTLYGLLLHRPSQLLSRRGPDLYEALVAIKDSGLVQHVGFSAYSPEELETILRRFPADLVQVPLNVLDRRMLESGMLDELASAGVEIHTRSAFLQGLLLMPAADRPPRFLRWERLFRAWDDWLGSNSVSALSACLGFVLSRQEISRVVVGVNNSAQMEDIVLALRHARSVKVPAEIRSSDLELLEPARWGFA